MQRVASLSYWLAASLVTWAVGCDHGDRADADGQEPSGSVGASGEPQARPSPTEEEGTGLRAGRRPDRRYVLVYGAKECVVFWEKGDTRSEPEVVRCPRELRQGERIRLSGSVCFREGDSRDRDAPVRCPTDLVDRERADRADGG